MKKIVLIFVITGLLIITIILWAINAHISGNIQEILMLAVLLVVIGFALYFGWRRIKSYRLKEPLEDELSKKMMIKASSLSYYISIYLWLFIMYVSDKTSLETHSLIGAGILGMAIIFFLSWLGIKLFGLKNG